MRVREPPAMCCQRINSVSFGGFSLETLLPLGFCQKKKVIIIIKQKKT